MDKFGSDDIKNLISFGGDSAAADNTDKSEAVEPSVSAPENESAPDAPNISDVPDSQENADAAQLIRHAPAEEITDTANISETQIIAPLTSTASDELNAPDAPDAPDDESGVAESGEYDEDAPVDAEAEDVTNDNVEEDADRPNGADIEYGYSFDGVYAEDDEIEEKPRSKAFTIVKWSIISVIVLAAVILFAITDTGIIGAYKRNFSHNFHKLFHISETPVTENIPGADTVPEPAPDEQNGQSAPDAVNAPDAAAPDSGVNAGETVQTETAEDERKAEFVNMDVKSSAIIPYEFASESDYGAWKGGVVCAATNYMCFINGKGETEWECATSVIDPILEIAGDYILIAQEGGTKLCLYEGEKLLYDVDCNDNILTADLSDNGDCVLVTTKDLYKGAIAAYNKSGNLVFARSSGAGSVIDASISPSSRNIAAALLDTEDAVRSTIEIFDITKDDPIASTDFDDTILFDVEYFGNIVNAFGDNGIAGVRVDGGVIYDLRFTDAELNHYAYDTDGNKLLMLSASNIPTLMAYNLRGREKGGFTALDTADFLCIDGNRLMYNNDRDIIAGKLTGKVFERYTASMDIRELIQVDKETFFVVYSNSLELIKK